jgi:hypothetical protein
VASFTAEVLIDRAKAAADINGNFVTETQWIRWLNVERAWLEHFLLRAGYVPRETSVDITITAAGTEYPITDPIVILGVYEKQGDDRFRWISAGDHLQGPAGRSSATVAGGDRNDASSYRVIQSANGQISLQFYPFPSAGKVYRVFYVAEPTAITSIANTVNYPGGIEERIVLGMARRALAKEESGTGEISRQLAECEREVERFCWDRITAGPQQVRNVDKQVRGWVSEPQIPTRERWLWI